MTATAAPIPFPRLLAVETRKLFDTRSGKVMTAILAALTVAAIAARGLVAGPDYQLLLGTAGIGYGTLLPVLGILTVTGEWSHRTALTTFALEPRRWRVMAAKCVPPLVTAVVAVAFAMLVAVPVTAVIAGAEGVAASWEIDVAALLGWTVSCVLGVAMGLALGLLLLNAPAAIVITLTSTLVWSTVRLLGDVGATLAEWLDLNTAATPLMDGELTGGDALRLAVAATFWIVLPGVAGMIRVARKEVT